MDRGSWWEYSPCGLKESESTEQHKTFFMFKTLLMEKMDNAEAWGWLISLLFNFIGTIFTSESDIPNKVIAKKQHQSFY